MTYILEAYEKMQKRANSLLALEDAARGGRNVVLIHPGDVDKLLAQPQIQYGPSSPETGFPATGWFAFLGDTWFYESPLGARRSEDETRAMVDAIMLAR